MNHSLPFLLQKKLLEANREVIYSSKDLTYNDKSPIAQGWERAKNFFSGKKPCKILLEPATERWIFNRPNDPITVAISNLFKKQLFVHFDHPAFIQVLDDKGDVIAPPKFSFLILGALEKNKIVKIRQKYFHQNQWEPEFVIKAIPSEDPDSERLLGTLLKNTIITPRPLDAFEFKLTFARAV